MVDVINNVNNTMKAPRLNIGVINPPDKLPSVQLYSGEKAAKEFRNISNDLYDSKNKVSYESTLETPKGVIVLFGICAAALGLKFLVSGIKKLKH